MVPIPMVIEVLLALLKKVELVDPESNSQASAADVTCSSGENRNTPRQLWSNKIGVLDL